MATARIDASVVYRAASAKCDAINAVRDVSRKADIEKIQREPQISGPFWKRKIKVLSAAEAAEEYDSRLKCGYRTSEWWNDTERCAGLGLAAKIRQLAKAALRDGTTYSGIGRGDGGDGFVTLDHDEARFLGLGVAQ